MNGFERIFFFSINVTYPIRAGWTDNFTGIYAFDGDETLTGEPLFIAPQEGNFSLQPDSPRSDVGAFPAGMPVEFWWKKDFPPKFAFED